MTDLFLSGSLWEVLGWTMLHFLWMGCVAFAISAGVRWCVRRYSAEVRYSAALLCLLGVTGAAGAALFVSTHQVDSAVRTAERESAVLEFASIEAAAPLSAEWMQHGSLPQLPAAQPQAVGRNMTASEAFWQWILQGFLDVFALLLPWLWVCGTPLVILLLFTGIIGTTRLRRRSTAVTDEQLLSQMKHLGELLGISRHVGIAVCDQITSPMVIGILRPLIVLPPSIISGLAPAQLEMILMHELAHVRRWDNLVNLLQRTIEALLFYHPVVWWASRWVRLEREHCCDALVLNHNHTPQSYAETLAALALPELAPQFATAAMANHQLTSRICHILNVEERTMSISIRTVVSCIVLLAAGVSGFLLATMRPGQVVAEDPPAEEALESSADNEESTEDLLFGVGLNSDAGLIGQILVNDGGSVLLGGLNSDRPAGWIADQASGPPDVPDAGDNELAWASLTEDDQPEWLRLTYKEPVRVAAIIVHESFNPGALSKVVTIDSAGTEVVIWEGDDPAHVQDGKGTSLILCNQILDVSEITLHLDSPAVAGRNEIDAVGLIDRFTGQVHWATSAEASSSFADHAPHSQADYYYQYHDFQSIDSYANCRKCHAGPAETTTREQRMQQLRTELQRLEAEMALEEALTEHAELQGQLRYPEAELAEKEVRALDAWLRARSDNEEALGAWWGPDHGLAQQQFSELNEDALDNDSDQYEELRQTLLQQQQAIERLTEVLDELRQHLNPPADDSGEESDADGDGVSIQIPAMGPAPLALDFAFPLESSNVIDDFLQDRWKQFGIEDSGEITDEDFIRRIYLDLLGRPPTVEELKQFLENESPTSRQELIKGLLQSEDAADNWNKAFSFYLGFER